MRTARERYESDPHFRMLVSVFYREFSNFNASGAGLTPSEIREASGFAWQMYMERHPSPLLVEPPQGWEKP